MRKKIVETKDIESIEITCDDCGKLITYRSHTCCMCYKDLCEACYHVNGSDCYGDYPPVYCKDCLDIGKPYIDEMKKSEDENEEKCDSISKLWRLKCLERRAKDEKSNFIPEFQDCQNC